MTEWVLGNGKWDLKKVWLEYLDSYTPSGAPYPQPKENDARAVLVFCLYTLLVFRPDRAMTPACMDNIYQNGLMSERNASALALIFGGILHYHSLPAKK